MRVCPRCAEETEHELCPHDGAQTFPVQVAQQTYPAGTIIGGRYQVQQVIGIGGFGAVYRCTQLNMNQTVAVKVLRNEHLTSLEHVKRFTREAQSVSRLKHPNTIHIFDFGSHTDGALYVAMEFLEGETLAQRLDDHGQIYWETMVQIAIQVCHSLTEAHATGLVHRDLKPENIMLIPVAGDPNFVKVLDFGIAKMQKDPTKPGEASLTEAGMIMGTPTYMAPEQAKGEEVDARADVYALGVLMYEGLTGHPPFQDATAMKVLVAHIKDPVKPFPRRGDPGEPPVELEQVVLQCLEKEPFRRPTSTVQLVDRLMLSTRRAREANQALANAGEMLTTQVEAVASTVSMSGVSSPSSPSHPAVAPLPGPAHLGPSRQSDDFSKPSVANSPRPEAEDRRAAGPKVPLLVAGGALVAVAAGVAVALAVLGPSSPAPAVAVKPVEAAAAPAMASPAAAQEPAAPPAQPPQPTQAQAPAPAPLKEAPGTAEVVPAAADGRADAKASGGPGVGKLEAGRVEAGKVEAGKVEAGKAEAAKVEAGKAEAAKVEAGKLNAGKSETAKADPTKPGPAKVDATAAPGAPAAKPAGGPDAAAATEPKPEPKPEEKKKPGKDDFRLDD